MKTSVNKLIKKSLAILGAVIMAISGFSLSAPATASTALDLNYGELSFQPEPDLTRSTAELKVGFSRTYSSVVTIGGEAVDAKVSIWEVQGNPNSEIDTFDEYDNSQHLSFHTQVSGTSSAQASAGFTVQFLRSGTNTPVVLRNIRASIADIDGHEFARFWYTSGYKLGSPTSLSLQENPARTDYATFISSASGTSNTDQSRIVEVNYDAASSISFNAGCRTNAYTSVGSSGRCGFTVVIGTLLLTGATSAQTVTQPSKTITYDANGATAGTAPAATTGSGVMTIESNTGSLIKNTDTFSGWNTRADGAGLFVPAGSDYAPNGNVTLYAQYSGALSPKTVTFLPNTGSGTMGPQTSSTPLALTANGFTNTGFTFAGWNTMADGSGTPYAGGDTYSFSADMTLHAQWTPVGGGAQSTPHTVTYLANGGTGSMANQTSATPDNLTSVTFTNPGNTFAGWNTMADGSGVDYVDGVSYDFAADLTLHAKWTPVQQQAPQVVTPVILFHAVNYLANGGEGSMQDQVSSIPQLLSSSSFTREGFTFAGWNTMADGSGETYVPGQSYAFAADLTLHALWTPVLVEEPVAVEAEETLEELAETGADSMSTLLLGIGSAFAIAGASLLLLRRFGTTRL
jgi:uncharacterized repeat protein (TIGR02543 family)